MTGVPRGGESTALGWIRLEINKQTALVTLGLFVIFFAVMALIQFSTPDMPDNDGYYHIRMAYLMRTEGVRPNFPYLPLTILNAREFYDHHFLFHVALMPFTLGDLRLGAKWAAVTFASLAFLCVWWLLRGQRIPYAWLWAVGILAVSDAFLYRMSITRVQSLSLGVLAIALHWMLTGKYTRLLPLAFFYVWLYNAFPLLPVMAGAYLVAVWLIERRFEWRPVMYTTVGVLLGLVINPYFPVDLVFIFRHLLPKLVETTAVSVGNEWYPYNTQQLLENSLFSLIAFAAGILGLGLNNKRMDARTALSLLLTLMFGLMLFRSRRFIEYFPPFALIFAAFAWAPLLEQLDPSPKGRLQRLLNKAPAAILAVLVAAGIIKGLPAVVESIRGSQDYRTYADAAAWLVANTPPGERIFQTDWDDFPRLFFYDTHNTYIVGLDPTYLQLYDAQLYDRWVKITDGDVDDLSDAIVNDFAAYYVHTDVYHGDFIRAAANDSNLVEVYRDNYAIIYQILP